MDADFDDWARGRLPRLLQSAYLLTGDQHLAEDLVQTCLEKLCLAWRRIDQNPDAYARTVLHREHIGQWRRHRVRELVTPSPPEVAAPDRTAAVDTRLVLQTALARLTAAQRSVLVLRYFNDLSEAETAVALDCSVGTVKSQTAKALGKLRLDPAIAAEADGGERR